MSTLKEPPPARLFMSILFHGSAEPKDSAILMEAVELLQRRYGPLDTLSPILPFRFTTYYQKEMGEPLWRRLLAFERLVPRDGLVDAKLFSADLERRFVDESGHRRLNLDPGLLSLESLVLATGKLNAHRIYLGRGVSADLTLLYQNRRFAPLPWTYPDYASAELLAILHGMRQRLAEALKPPG